MENKNYIAYEYKTVQVKEKDLSRVIDLYESFGWEVSKTSSSISIGTVIVSLKRDRKIKHKHELTKLERTATDYLERINKLEKSKSSKATTFSICFGVIASLVLGGGMCLTMLDFELPFFIGGIISGIVGIVLCSVNYPLYKSIVAKTTKKVLPLIDETDEKLANTLEQGNLLLSANQI